MIKACRLCPRLCGAQRGPLSGDGICRSGMLPRVVRAAPHQWEEPCISGTRGSGAIFFSGCAMGCAHCQNASISREPLGTPMTVDRLISLWNDLTEQGVHNINLVTPSHYLPVIREALIKSKPSVPVVWNTGAYERVEALRSLDGLVDVYLPDLKHVSSRLSALLANAADYFEYASKAIQEMCRQTGTPCYDANGLMIRGTMVRHLLLPGATGDARRVLEFVKHDLPEGTPVSLMRQYTPQDGVGIKGMNRRVTDAEYARVTDAMREMDIPGFIQEKGSADSAYTPAFDGTGVYKAET